MVCPINLSSIIRNARLSGRLILRTPLQPVNEPQGDSYRAEKIPTLLRAWDRVLAKGVSENDTKFSMSVINRDVTPTIPIIRCNAFGRSGTGKGFPYLNCAKHFTSAVPFTTFMMEDYCVA